MIPPLSLVGPDDRLCYQTVEFEEEIALVFRTDIVRKSRTVQPPSVKTMIRVLLGRKDQQRGYNKTLLFRTWEYNLSAIRTGTLFPSAARIKLHRFIVHPLLEGEERNREILQPYSEEFAALVIAMVEKLILHEPTDW